MKDSREWEFLELACRVESYANIIKCYGDKLSELMGKDEFKAFRKETGKKLIRNELEGIKDEKIKSLAEELVEEIIK
jgi:hypothetical protein